tara:strand:+ start:1085 stop:1633 length:549 start_codon:yes stop_codon:yes gene_type:complete
MNLREVREDLLTPTVNWIVNNGVEELIELERCLDVLNTARDDYGRSVKIVLQSILTLRQAYARLAEDLDDISRAREARFAQLSSLYMRKDDTNPFYKVNTTQKFAENMAKDDDEVRKYDLVIEKLKQHKQKVWGFKEMLEQVLEACAVIAENPERTRPSGKVLDDEDVESIVAEFKEKFQSN